MDGELLKEAGYLYVRGWVRGDPPIRMRKLRSQPLRVVSGKLNDSPRVAHRQHTNVLPEVRGDPVRDVIDAHLPVVGLRMIGAAFFGGENFQVLAR